jgi:hypothetical protein
VVPDNDEAAIAGAIAWLISEVYHIFRYIEPGLPVKRRVHFRAMANQLQ